MASRAKSAQLGFHLSWAGGPFCLHLFTARAWLAGLVVLSAWDFMQPTVRISGTSAGSSDHSRGRLYGGGSLWLRLVQGRFFVSSGSSDHLTGRLYGDGTFWLRLVQGVSLVFSLWASDTSVVRLPIWQSGRSTQSRLQRLENLDLG